MRAAILPCPPTARIAVIADTHSAPHARAVERVAALRPHAILHAGDIGDLSVLDSFSEIAPVHAVRGNIDARSSGLPEVLTLEVPGRLRIFLTHIAVNGPRLRADVARRAQAEGAHLVVCGHSHLPFIGRDRGLPMFNPGSVGPRRFALPIVFGTIELAPDGVRLMHWNCETGEPWLPPEPAVRRATT